LVGHFGPLPDQGTDVGVDLGEPAPVDRDRLRAGAPGFIAGPEAVDERTGVLERETRREQRADLRDQPEVGLVVLAVAVRRTPCREQSLLLVVAQGAGAHAGPLGQFPDSHRFLPDPIGDGTP
jgi:hypothetical protein